MEANASGSAPTKSWLDRAPSWWFLALLAGLVGFAAVLSLLFPQVFWHPSDQTKLNQCPDPRLNQFGLYDGYARDGFFYDYYWMPIVCDEGYNSINTLSWAVLLGIMLLWAYRLTAELRERVELGLILAVVPYLIWGSIYRVLEDSDFFGPFSEGIDAARQAGTLSGKTGTSCVPAVGGSFADQCFGVFLITPIIYVIVTFIAVGFLFWSHRARRVAQAQNPMRAVQYFAYTVLILVALYTALWASEPTLIRHVAHPVVALLAALVAFWTVYRMTEKRGHFNPHVGMAAYGLFFLVIGLYYMLLWMTGGVPGWRPDPPEAEVLRYPLPLVTQINDWPIQGWVLLACIVGPGLAAYGVWRLGRIFGGAERGPEPLKPRRDPGVVVTALILLSILIALASFGTLVGLRDFAQRQIAGDWKSETFNYVKNFLLILVGPAAIAVAAWAARRFAAGGVGVHPALLYFTLPLNLLMVVAQATDAMMTSLGLDLYNYTEKHVLPGFLIAKADQANLPGILDAFPTALVFIPLKLLIVLLVVVAIDASAEKEFKGRENLIGLVKLGIIMVGLSPGVRDAVRLAMAT